MQADKVSFLFEICRESTVQCLSISSKRFFFCGREPKRITCQGSVPSFTIEENLFRENYFIGGKTNDFGTFEIL